MSRAKMKKERAVEAKQRKQKMLVVIGAVLLAAVLAFQLPKMLKGGSESTASDVPPTITTPTSPSATPAPDASLATAVLPVPDAPPQPAEGQLVSFERFEAQDPFVQQASPVAPPSKSSDSTSYPAPATEPVKESEPVAPAPAPAAPAPASPTPPESPASPPTTTDPVVAEPEQDEPEQAEPAEPTPPATSDPVEPVTPPAVTPPPSAPPAPTPPVTNPSPITPPALAPTPAPAVKATTATISVNGVSETVQVGGRFPKVDPVFELVGLADDVAEIGIVGGSYQDGAATVSLEHGRTLTLMNTADGTRYALRLELRR